MAKKPPRPRNAPRLPQESPSALDRLVNAGCRRDQLEAQLHVMRDTQRFEDDPGVDRLDPGFIARLSRDMRDVAQRIERFIASADGRFLLLRPTPTALVPLRELLRLGYTELEAVALLRDKHPAISYSNAGLANLIAHVKTATGRFHDTEIGDLVGRTAPAIRQWRIRNRQLVDAALQEADSARSPVGTPPPEHT